jgi:hypothetical protein
MYIQQQHRVVYEEEGMEVDKQLTDEILLETSTPYGDMKHLGPILQMSQTPPVWDRPSSPLGTHGASWL